MFALTLYNLLTPDDLTKGHIIAGTGTIDREGRVGEIGGVEQKVAAAASAGAQYFLCPVTNFPAAKQVARRIKLLPVKTVTEAIEYLRDLPLP